MAVIIETHSQFYVNFTHRQQVNERADGRFLTAVPYFSEYIVNGDRVSMPEGDVQADAYLNITKDK